MGDRIKQVLGKINKKIIDKWYLDKYRDKKIVFYEDRIEHCKEHIDEYKNKEDFYYTLKNLDKIIKSPDYVFYDSKKKGLEYYKKLKGNILVAVRINNGYELKVKSFYPVDKSKIVGRKKKEVKALKQALIEKYKYKEPV